LVSGNNDGQNIFLSSHIEVAGKRFSRLFWYFNTCATIPYKITAFIFNIAVHGHPYFFKELRTILATTLKTIHRVVCLKRDYAFLFCYRARILYILKNQLFALKYILKHSLIKIN